MATVKSICYIIKFKATIPSGIVAFCSTAFNAKPFSQTRFLVIAPRLNRLQALFFNGFSSEQLQILLLFIPHLPSIS